MSNMSELECTLNDLVAATQNMLNAANKLKDLILKKETSASNSNKEIKEPVVKEVPLTVKPYSFQEVRGIMATLAASGKKMEAKQLLSDLGASCLSVSMKLRRLSMAKHAFLSASSSDCWINCPPSAKLCEGIVDEPSSFAQEGTDCHELCAYLVEKGLSRNVKDPTSTLSYYNGEMQNCAKEYCNYVLEQYEKAKEYYDDALIFIEQRLDFSKWVKDGFGAGDCVIVANQVLHIIDYKHTLGVLVNSKENTQVLCYALGALEAFDDLYDIEQIEMTIFQTRRENISTSYVTKDDLLDWAENVLKPILAPTATRVGMGNLVGVVAAISAGGAGAVFWMWVTAIIGSSTAFIEATLAQLYKEKDPLYGGYRGGPAYYIHAYVEEKQKKKRNKVVISVLFAISGLICWCGISQVISNSVVSSFKNAFSIPPIYMTVVLVAVAAVIVLRKDATVKILDMVVPVMAVCYFAITILIIVMNLGSLPGVFARIFEEAFGFRQAAAGGFGAVLMNGIKRGLFSNEAGSGSAPCAAAAAECDQPVKAGLVQALGVFVDTIVICSCTAFIMLLAPEGKVAGLSGMNLLQTAMEYHLGRFGVIFIATTLFLFSFSTFLGILFYARSNVAYLFGDNWASQTAYKVLALVMLFIGGLATYTFVWDLGDVGIGLMTIFNIIILYPQGEKALKELKEYEKEKRK